MRSVGKIKTYILC